MQSLYRRYTPDIAARSLDAAGTDSGELPAITGMAAVYYDASRSEDTQYMLARSVDGVVVERLFPGIFEPALSNPDDILALQDHDPALFLGRRSSGTLHIELTPAGMAYRIQTPPTKVGLDTLALIQRRDITGSSFSMWKARGAWSLEIVGTEKRYVRTVQSFEKLVDLGPVLQPAYPGTSAIIGARSCGITQLSRSAGPPAEIADIEAELADFVRSNWLQAEADLRLRQLQLRQAAAIF